jgi:hypothetical protein
VLPCTHVSEFVTVYLKYSQQRPFHCHGSSQSAFSQQGPLQAHTDLVFVAWSQVADTCKKQSPPSYTLISKVHMTMVQDQCFDVYRSEVVMHEGRVVMCDTHQMNTRKLSSEPETSSLLLRLQSSYHPDCQQGNNRHLIPSCATDTPASPCNNDRRRLHHTTPHQSTPHHTSCKLTAPSQGVQSDGLVLAILYRIKRASSC